jgi:hypothetical protein
MVPFQRNGMVPFLRSVGTEKWNGTVLSCVRLGEFRAECIAITLTYIPLIEA